MKYFFVFLALTGGKFVYSGYIYDNCKCPWEYYEVLKGLGTECLYDEDCITRNSFCKGNKICACKIGYQYDPGSDVCFPKEVDLKCNEDYDCSALQNAKCSNGRCQCKFDYVPAKDKGTCLPSMRLTSICEEDSQCNTVMNRSYCDPVMKHCVCERGLQQDPYRMQCLEQPKLHIPCMTTRDCEVIPQNIGKVECKEKPSSMWRECECKEGYYERDNICYENGSSHAVLSLPALFALLLVKWLM